MKYGRYFVIFLVFLLGGCTTDQSNETPLFIGVDAYYIPVGYEFDGFDTLVRLSDVEDGEVPITENMINTRNVNYHEAGEYPVYYTYTDSDGNKTVYRLMMHVLPTNDYYQALVSGELDMAFTDRESCIETLLDLLGEEQTDLSSVSGTRFYEGYKNISLTDIALNEGLNNVTATIYTTNTGFSLLVVTYEEYGCIKIYDAIIVYNDLFKAVEVFTDDERLILTQIGGPLETNEMVLNEYLVSNNITDTDIQDIIQDNDVNPDYTYVYETSWEYNEYTWNDCVLVFSVDGFYVMIYWL